MAERKPFWTIPRLQWGLVASSVLLVAVLAGYIGYARLAKRWHFNPGKLLGPHVTMDSNGVTYSGTDGKRTLYTIHAATQIKYQDGRMTLKNVGIVLYGKKGDRADRIHGNEFEYDPRAEVISSAGDVFIDLAPPSPSAASGKTNKPDDESRMIHLKTSGLTYRQKDQFAETSNRLDFMAGGMSGNAVGATYDAGKGVVVLQSQVHASGLRGHTGSAAGSERPLVLTASHAELDRDGNVAIFEMAKMDTASDSGTQSGAANHAVLYLTADGTPKHLDANGNVTLTGEGRGTVTSDRLAMDMYASGEPHTAHLMGVVRFTNVDQARQEYGKSNEARVAFNEKGNPVHATMTGNVETDFNAGPSTRWLGAETLDLALEGGGREPLMVRTAEATASGGARVRMVDSIARTDKAGKLMPEIRRTNLRADVLKGQFAASGKVAELTGLDGTGRTLVERIVFDTAANGAVGAQQSKETGTGDTLRMGFKPDAGGRSQLARAEQRGGVKIVREALAKKPGDPPYVEHADGDDAVYEAATDTITMTGQVRVADADSSLFADRVTFDRGTGDGRAEGSVRVSYLQEGSSQSKDKGEPMHVSAARSVGHKATGITEFFAAPDGTPARMWQAGSQVEAQVLEFDRARKSLRALGSEGHAVKTVLVDTEPPKLGARQPSNAPVRVFSHDAVYNDVTRQVVFRGQVQVNDQDGVMRAPEATVYLSAKGAAPVAKDATAPMSLGGKVDHMIADGGVEITQPGRKATGEKLVYTASDRLFVLTGTKTVPPKMEDDTQGSVTGAELRFKSGDDSVEVVSGDGSKRVVTVTHVKQKE